MEAMTVDRTKKIERWRKRWSEQTQQEAVTQALSVDPYDHYKIKYQFPNGHTGVVEVSRSWFDKVQRLHRQLTENERTGTYTHRPRNQVLPRPELFAIWAKYGRPVDSMGSVNPEKLETIKIQTYRDYMESRFH